MSPDIDLKLPLLSPLFDLVGEWRINWDFILEADHILDNLSQVTEIKSGTKRVNLKEVTFETDPFDMNYPILRVNFVAYEFLQAEKTEKRLIVDAYMPLNDIIIQENSDNMNSKSIQQR